MKILFIQPPIRDFYRTAFREYPLGLLYIAAAMKSLGHDVSILDTRNKSKSKNIPIPKDFKYLEKYYTKANNLFLNYKHFGLSFEEIAKKTQETNPDLVCISSLFTPYINEVLETAKSIKTKLPGIKIACGGHHLTADPNSIIKSRCIDHVVCGEGEIGLKNLINSNFKDKIVFGSDEPFRIEDLDKNDLPARELIDPDRYKFEKRRYTMLLTSRGCPHRCSFCSVHQLSGHNYRKRSIDNIMDELDICINKHNISAIDFQDDNLLFDQNRIKILFEKIIQRYEEKDLLFMATNGLNIFHLDKELLTLMKKIGFRKLDLALATGDVPSRDQLERPENIIQFEKTLELSNNLGLNVTTYIILGLPNQSLYEMEKTIEYLESKETLISPSIFYNVPGMPIFDQMMKYEYSNKHTNRRSSAFNNHGKDFQRDDIFQLFKRIRQFNLKRIKYDN